MNQSATPRSSSRPLCGRIETLRNTSRPVQQRLDTAPGGAYSTNGAEMSDLPPGLLAGEVAHHIGDEVALIDGARQLECATVAQPADHEVGDRAPRRHVQIAG